MTSETKVTVIIPVYRGLGDVRRCVESVLRHTRRHDGAVDLLLIDDASPEAAVSEYLDEVARSSQPFAVELLRNDENLGFVRTVNRGLRATDGDVVVLNADTVVTHGWLDRLAKAARSRPGVATVTPLTSFGSICTLPRSVIDAFELHGENPSIDDCADFVARNSLEMRPEIITGVGFCIYVTREALDVTGLLDEKSFGLGYGEEVDFCLRATRLGFVHLAEDSTFVFHAGGGSFGERRSEGMERSSTVLHDRYRFFRAANRSERAEDPLAVPFAALDVGLSERARERPHVMHMLHSPPDAVGGTEKHLRRLMEALLDEFDFSILYPVESGFVLATMWVGAEGDLVEREFLLPGAARQVTRNCDENAAEALRVALDAFDVDAVHIQNLIGHSLAPLDVLSDFEGRVVCSVRDLYLACPNHSLLYRDALACGIPEDLSVCGRCLPETRGMSTDDLSEFRARVEDRLATVDQWVFASYSAADYFRRAYPLPRDRRVFIEHGAILDEDPALRALDAALVADEPLRVAFVGMGWAKKGLTTVNALADEFAAEDIEIHHFGELKQSCSPELRTHGTYDNALLPELLRRTGIHVVLLPGPYAETFGHVMTEALISGLPVIGASYGALGERIRRHGCGWTVDPADRRAIRDLIRSLDRCRLELLRTTQRAIEVEVEPVEATAARYAQLYRGAPCEETR